MACLRCTLGTRGEQAEMKISTILDHIDNGHMALPEFQRGYVWNRDQVRGLFHSLYLRHPVGGLLVWATEPESTRHRGEGRLAAGVVIPLRSDFSGDDLRALARSSGDAKQARRLLALSLIYDGASRSEATWHGGVDLQTVRDWVLRFNAEGPDGLVDRKSPGTPPRLNTEQRAALVRVVEEGSTPYLDGVVRWRLCDLVSWVHGEFAISLDQSTVRRMLRDMSYRKLKARPRHHAQDPEAMSAFKKTSRPEWRKSGTTSHQGRP